MDNWQELFDKKFVNPFLLNKKLVNESDWWTKQTQPEKVKGFIQSLLNQQKKELLEKIVLKQRTPEEFTAAQRQSMSDYYQPGYIYQLAIDDLEALKQSLGKEAK
jgi:ribosomal protein S17E